MKTAEQVVADALGIKVDCSPEALAESARKTQNLNDAVLAFLRKLDELHMVTGWEGAPVERVAQYITYYIIGAMRGK